MRSSSRPVLGLALVLAAALHAPPARAQQAQPQKAQGFAVERFYPSAPGGGWFVMDALEMQGGLSGTLALTFGYARDPLRVTSGVQRLAVVSDEAFAAIGAALSYRFFRFYIGFSSPLVLRGDSGTVGAYAFSSPTLDIARAPDAISDVRIGADARIVGEPGGPFRLGAGAQLFVPNGSRNDYDTDGTFRAMFRALFAGDAGAFTYAGHLGVHVRPLDDATPGSPQGHEFLFGFAAGARLPLGRGGTWHGVLGPEVWGATAFRSSFAAGGGPGTCDGTDPTCATAFRPFVAAGGTAVESILSARFEGTVAPNLGLRVKLGSGIGSDRTFGAPAFRAVVGVEGFTPGR